MWEQAILQIVFFCYNTFTFMLTCVQVQFKGSSREIEQQVKQHEISTSNKKSNVKSRLKKNTVFFKKILYSILFLYR